MAIDVEVFCWEVGIRVQDFQGALGEKWHQHDSAKVRVWTKETVFKEVSGNSCPFHQHSPAETKWSSHKRRGRNRRQVVRGKKWQESAFERNQHQWHSRRDRMKGKGCKQLSAWNSLKSSISTSKVHFSCWSIQNIMAYTCTRAGKGHCLIHLNS